MEYACPVCGKEIEYGAPACPHCGQELGWGEVEETVAEETVEVAEETAEETAEAVVESYEEAEEVEEVDVGEKSPKGFSIAAFVLSICGAVFALTPIGVVLSVLALVFNGVYKKKGGESNKITKATKIIALIALIVSALVTVTVLAGGSVFAILNWDNLGKFFKGFWNWLERFPKLFRVFK